MDAKNKIIRNLKIKGYFRDKTNTNTQRKKFQYANTWQPAASKLPDDVLNTTYKINKQTEELLEQLPGTRQGALALPHKHNLSKDEFLALKKLGGNQNIVIKSADKGGSIVLLDREAYIQEAVRQLSNTKYYVQLNEPIYSNNIDKINHILEGLYKNGTITINQLNYLSANPNTCRPRIFYLLPKIHKDPHTWPAPNCPAGRPIVSDCSSESYHVSEYIDSFIAPLSITHTAYLKDTYDFIGKVKNKTINQNCLLVTGDVTSLYTNMNLDRILQVVEQAFRDNPDDSRPSKEILQLLDITLKGNDFTFNDNYYLQIQGVPMGKVYAPGIANLYLQYFDYMAMNGFRIKPEYYARFLDDIFIIWGSNLDDLMEYNTFLNNLIPDIEITLKHNNTKIDFLDTSVYKVIQPDSDTCILHTKVYFKETDAHQLLHTASFHPKHTSAGVLKSQVLRFKRICSTYEDYSEACYILFGAIQKRGYSSSKLRKMKRDVWRLQEHQKAATNTTKEKPLIPLILRYNQFGPKFMNLWKSIIKDNEEFDNARLVAAYSKNKNLGNYLIKSKLSPLIENRDSQAINNNAILAKNHAFKACRSSRCLTCKLHASDKNHFESTKKVAKFTFKDNLSCNSTNIIYLITCRKCGIQYVGETKRELRERLTNHRSDIKTRKLTAIGIHFNGSEHSVLDVQAVAIEQIIEGPFSDITRKQREQFWQNKLCTKFPDGLNCMPLNE